MEDLLKQILSKLEGLEEENKELKKEVRELKKKRSLEKSSKKKKESVPEEDGSEVPEGFSDCSQQDPSEYMEEDVDTYGWYLRFGVVPKPVKALEIPKGVSHPRDPGMYYSSKELLWLSSKFKELDGTPVPVVEGKSTHVWKYVGKMYYNRQLTNHYACIPIDTVEIADVLGTELKWNAEEGIWEC